MKKTYISPEMLTVQLGTVHMMAESMFVDTAGTTSVTDGSGGWVKETTPSDVNVWDKEW